MRLVVALVTIVAGICSGGTQAALPQDVVFVGRLVQTTLIPKDWDKLPVTPDGKVEVSNSCGTETSELEVVEPLLDVSFAKGQHVQVSSELGEWCEPEFTISRDSVFVSAKLVDGAYRTIAVYPLDHLKDGTEIFYPAFDAELGGTRLWALMCPVKDGDEVTDGPQPEFAAKPHTRYLAEHGLYRIAGDRVYLAGGVYLKTFRKFGSLAALEAAKTRCAP